MAIPAKKIARWYREVSQHMKSGISLPQAVEVAGGIPQRNRSRLAEQLRNGAPVETALEEAARWLPEVDRHVIACAARSGKMVETLAVLAKKREFVAKQAGKAMVGSLYPLFIIHFGILLLLVYLSFTASLEVALRTVVPVFLLLWGCLGLVVWLVRRRNPLVRGGMLLVPLLRGYTKNQAIADLCFALNGYVVAGQAIDSAWTGAGKASGDRRLLHSAERIADGARQGIPPGAKLGDFGVFPEEFISLYRTGEATGQLEENLYHLWQLYSERAANKLSAAGFWYPKLLVIGVILAVGYVVVKAYANYLDEILDLL